MQFAKTEKQEILDDHLKAHAGEFSPLAFVGEAEKGSHPAHQYFQWDNKKASHEWRLWQARQFVSGLRIEAKAIIAKPLRVDVTARTTTVEMPAVVSEGYGSYVSTTKREGREILMAEAARSLNNWLERYGGFVGLHVSTLPVEKLARALQSKVETEAA